MGIRCILRLMEAKVQSSLLDFFSHAGKFERLEKGSTLKTGNSVYLLVSGMVGMFSYTKDGVERAVNIFRPQALFPLSQVFTGKTDPYLYQAVSSVTVYRAQARDVERLLSTNHEVLLDLVKRIYRGLEGYYRRMEVLLAGGARQKLATSLLIHALRFGQKQEDGSWQVVVSQNFLGVQAGLSRETVARELAKLKKEGTVRYLGRKLIVKDIQVLEKETF